MTLNIALNARAAMLDGFEAFMVAGSLQASLTLYQTNIALCVFNLGASGTGTPFSAAAGDSITLSSTITLPLSNTGTSVAGTANRFILTGQVPSTALSGSLSAVGGGGDIEVPTTTVTASTTQRLNSFTIRMSAAGVLTVEASLVLV